MTILCKTQFFSYYYYYYYLFIYLFILTANGFLHGGSGATIRHNTQIAHIT
jgi:hypothetical protein